MKKLYLLIIVLLAFAAVPLRAAGALAADTDDALSASGSSGTTTSYRTMTHTLCSGETYCIGDTCISTAGRYLIHIATPSGRDSIIDLTVFVNNAYVTVREDHCKGDVVTLNGRLITSSCVVMDTLLSRCGGDSIVEHIINFHDAVQRTIIRKICPGDTVFFNGVAYTQPNNYMFRDKSQYGCDSITLLQVQNYPYYFIVIDTIVTDSVFLWQGKTLRRSGTYSAALKTVEGCDSTMVLKIYFDKEYKILLNKRICDGEIYNFHGKALTESGLYVDTLKTVTGRDSIIALNLQVLYTIYDTLVVRTCGDSYTFHGQEYKATGTYDIYEPYRQRPSGVPLTCDSIVYHLDLELCTKYRKKQTFTFTCDSLSYYWPPANYTFVYPPLSDSVVIHHTTTCGCDSDEVLLFTPLQSYTRLSKCEGSSVLIHGEPVTEAGTYTFMMKNACGLDSAEVIEVVDEPVTHKYDTAAICDGGSYMFNGRAIYDSGDYTDTFPKYDDCPLYHHLHLVVHDTFHIIERVEICTNRTYIWHGKAITQTGHYFAKFKTIHGCDSIFEADIIIHRPKWSNINAQICQGDSMRHGTRWHKATGLYYDTLKTSDGCDSIVQLTLNVMPKYLFVTRDTSCIGEYQFRGMTLTNSGIYYDSLKTAAGCDSVYKLELVMLSPSHTVDYVTECTNTPYVWRGRYLTQSGTYFDTMTNLTGCDSVYELRLTLYRPKFTTRNATICQGDSIQFGGRYLHSMGRYYDTVRTMYGCDSVLELCLNVQAPIVKQISATICEGDVYSFNGMLYSLPGIYFDTLTTVFGCDSIIRLVLQVTPSGNVNEEHVLICEGDSFSFRGHTFRNGDIFYDTLMTIHGCDSVVKYVFTLGTVMHDYKAATICQGDYYPFHGRNLMSSGTYTEVERDPVTGCESAVYHLDLTVNPVYYNYELDTICDDVTYFWHGQHITKSGTYIDSSTTIAGCDSVYVLQAVVYPRKLVDVNVTLCHGQSIRVNGRLYYEPGVYYDTAATCHGCDSITKLVVNFKPEYLFSDTVTVCRDSYYRFRGRNVKSPGTYRDTFATTTGCDSVYEIVLVAAPDVRNVEYDTVCSNAPYQWHGRLFTKSGVYRDTFATTEGCIGINELWLEYYESYKHARTVRLCPGQTYFYQGKNYSTPGTYVDSFKTIHGCDSIVTLLVLNDYDHEFFDSVVFCKGDYVNFHGRRIANTGDYTYVASTKNGCDSIFHLHAVVNPMSHIVDSVTLCSNDPYPWRGRFYFKSGLYFDTVPTPLGCDSVFELRLTLNRINTSTIHTIVCDGDQFWFRGKNYTKQGIYYDTVTCVHGCDSILKLVVDVTPTYLRSDTTYLCQGNSLQFQGKTISFTGTFRDTLRTVDGCDSIMELVVFPAPSPLHVEYDTLCSSEPYQWHGLQLTKKGIYRDTVRTTYGCNEIYELRLEYRNSYNITHHLAICPGQSYYYKGENRSTPGVYVDSLHTVYGCDSIVTLHVVTDHEHHYYDTTAICDDEYFMFHGRAVSKPGDYTKIYPATASGCDSVYHLHLIVNPKFRQVERDTVCSNELYCWRGKYYGHTGTYFDTIPTQSGCDSIFELRLVINPINTVTITAYICEGEEFFFRGVNYTQRGIYYDTLTSVFGCDSILKLIVDVAPSYLHTDTSYLCPGSTVFFRGRQLHMTGVFCDSLRTVNGCDSIFKMVVLPISHTYTLEYDTVCSEQPYYWHGKPLTKSGVYVDSFRTQEGCIGINELRLEYRRSYNVTSNVMLCPGQTYFYGGINRSKAGTYVDSLQTIYGCDSIVTTIVTNNDRHEFFDTVTICNGDYYNFFGQRINNPGNYKHTINTSTTGCDTTHNLHLIVNQNPRYMLADTVCENGYYYWRGRNLSRSGVYFDTVPTTEGCDSIYELRLVMYPHRDTVLQESICEGSTLWLHNKPYTQQGTYYDTLWNIHGCDSVVKLVLNVKSNFVVTRSDSICQGDTYYFYGQPYTTSGIHRQIIPSPNGCDSIFILDLTVIPVTHVRYDTTICNGDVFFFKGQRVTTPSLLFDTVAYNGCNSITEVRVNVKYAFYQYDTFYIVKGDTLYYRNRTYTRRGTYTEHHSSIEQCDSANFIMTLEYVPYEKHIFVETCDNHPFTFHGHVYARTTRDTILYQSGSEAIADTLFYVDVVVHPSGQTIIYDTLCNGGVYRFIHGQKLTKTGVYIDTLPTYYGCDSVITLYLEVLDSLYTYENVVVCETDPYTWVGPNRIITQPGHYYDSVPDPLNKCYHYYELDIAMVQETRVQTAVGVDNEIYVCADENTYTLWPTFTGTQPTEYFITYDGTKAPHSNDVTGTYDGVSIELPVPLDQNRAKVRPDNYTVTLSVGNGICDASVYSVNYTLHVLYDSAVIRQHFDNVVSVRNANYNGGYLFSGYLWWVNGKQVYGATESNLYYPGLMPGDIVYASLRRQNESDYVNTCELIIKPYSDFQQYPTLDGTYFLPGRIALLQSPENGSYALYDMKGALITSGDVINGETQITLPYISGLYLLKVKTDTFLETFKVIVR